VLEMGGRKRGGRERGKGERKLRVEASSDRRATGSLAVEDEPTMRETGQRGDEEGS
jgi:hypothetical protein